MGTRCVRIFVSGWVVLASVLLFSGRSGAVDLSVITNETALNFKIAMVRNMAHGPESLWTKKAEDLVRKDLEATGYFVILTPPPDLRSLLHREVLDGITAKAFSSMGVEGVVGTQFSMDANGVRLHGTVRDPLNGSVLLDKTYATGGPVRILVHRFVDDVLFQFAGIRGIAESRIAFVGRTRRGYDLFTMDFDGDNLRRMTYDHVLAFNPTWSRDKRRIVYVSYLRGQPQIIDYNLRTGHRTMLFSYPGLNITPQYSFDGSKLAVALSKGRSSQHTQIYVYHEKRHLLERITYSHSNNLSPTWDPGGNSIAFVSDRDGHPQIFIMDSDGSNVRRLTFDGNYNVAPAWSPRGDWIAYVCMNAVHRPKICLTSPDGSAHFQITHGIGRDDSPSWSPDGRFLIYSRQIRGHSTLVRIWMDGHGRENLGRFRRSILTPAWSGP
jgi:TolB protein